MTEAADPGMRVPRPRGEPVVCLDRTSSRWNAAGVIDELLAHRDSALTPGPISPLACVALRRLQIPGLGKSGLGLDLVRSWELRRVGDQARPDSLLAHNRVGYKGGRA
jgi:hypothetical protein